MRKKRLVKLLNTKFNENPFSSFRKFHAYRQICGRSGSFRRSAGLRTHIKIRNDDLTSTKTLRIYLFIALIGVITKTINFLG
jgi:hypothetical protein